MAKILAKRYLCGKAAVVLTHLHRTEGRNYWVFSVFNDNSDLIAHGNDFSTVHWPRRDNWKFAVRELLGFLCHADVETIREWGFSYDPDELFATCATRAGNTETEFVLSYLSYGGIMRNA